jgi:hypothetical protein
MLKVAAAKPLEVLGSGEMNFAQYLCRNGKRARKRFNRNVKFDTREIYF